MLERELQALDYSMPRDPCHQYHLLIDICVNHPLLQRRATLSEGDEVRVTGADGAAHTLRILELRPAPAVTLIDTDLEVEVSECVSEIPCPSGRSVRRPSREKAGLRRSRHQLRRKQRRRKPRRQQEKRWRRSARDRPPPRARRPRGRRLRRRDVRRRRRRRRRQGSHAGTPLRANSPLRSRRAVRAHTWWSVAPTARASRTASRATRRSALSSP